MLQCLGLRTGRASGDEYIPAFLYPLVEAASLGQNTVPIVETITKSLGFDNFMYGATAAVKPHHEANSYVFTTMPREWIRRYDEQAYIEVDPRIEASWNSAIPLVWDQDTFRGGSARCDAYLKDAFAYGIASGVCFLIHLPHECHVFISLSSRIPRIDQIRHRTISRNMPDILSFGHYFHELFMRAVVQRQMLPLARGAVLSARERECLALAASGMTTDDISLKLDIRPRTVQFHFDTIRTKLGAANRQEAIAIAVKDGTILLRTA